MADLSSFALVLELAWFQRFWGVEASSLALKKAARLSWAWDSSEDD
jgi:hypothetical protein